MKDIFQMKDLSRGKLRKGILMNDAELLSKAERMAAELKKLAVFKRALVLDTTKNELDYQQAQADWAKAYQQIFAWAAAERKLPMLYFLDEQKSVIGDEAYYAGIVKMLISSGHSMSSLISSESEPRSSK